MQQKFGTWVKRNWFASLLLVGLVFQSWSWGIDLLRDLRTVSRTFGQTAIWRSANNFQSQRMADYIQFLDQTIPLDARVVLPPAGSGPRALTTTPAMQYYLAPRLVINCPDIDCLSNISLQNTYVVVLSVEQARLFDREGSIRLDYDGWGLILPRGAQQSNPDARVPFTSWIELLFHAAAPVGWLLLLTCFGALLVAILFPEGQALLQLVLGYGLGLSFYSLGASIYSLAGFSLSAGLGWSLSLFLFLGMSLVYWRSRKIYFRVWLDWLARVRSQVDVWVLLILVLGFLSVLIGVGKSYHSSDAIQLWGSKGYGIASDRTISEVLNWGTNTVPYPLHVPVLIAQMRLSFREILPASKLVFSGYYLAMLLLVYLGTRQLGKLRPYSAGLAAVLLGTGPLVFRHATIAYANLPLAFYLAAGVIVLGHSLGRGNRSAWLLAGILFASAAWTRPEGLSLALVGILVLLVRNLSLKTLNSFKPWLYLAVPVLSYAVYWSLLTITIYADGSAKSSLPGEIITQMAAGNFHLDSAVFVVQSMLLAFFDVSTWGSLSWILIAAWELNWIYHRHTSHVAGYFIWTGLIYLAGIFGIYFAAGFDTIHDLSWWVNTGLDRMMLPGVLILWLGVLVGMDLLDDREPGARSLDC